MRWLLRVVAVLLLLIIVVAGGAYLWLRGSLPQTDGRIAIAGASAAIEVVRDRQGVPHIYAQSKADAFFGLGFVHAQDRLWQMEMNRRIAAGRLAEVVGNVPAAVGTDRFLRTLGVRRSATAGYDRLDAESRAALDAYAAGVNAFLAQRKGPLPPEFLFFGHAPEKWEVADSLAWVKMMAWDLAGNWGDELLRARLIKRLSPEQMTDIFPGYPANGPVVLRDYAEALGGIDIETLHAALPAMPDRENGSNNWVVSGTRSETGKPLLANDPHLSLGAPSLWYFAHMKAPGLDVIGATLPGVPAVVLGRNDRIAWGFTNTGPDTQDLFIERIDPANPGRYATPNGTEAFVTRNETIRIKGAPDMPLTVRETRHGPVISDLIASAAQAAGEGHVLAFSWPTLRDDDLTAQAGLHMQTARNWDEFTAALREFHSPQQNIVYADIDGNIGFYAPARVPVRTPLNDINGHLPSPGWDARYDWQGFIPFDQLPHLYNPAAGAIVTANNKIVPDDYPFYLTDDWAVPFRAERIQELLDKTAKHSTTSFRAIQNDVQSGAAEMFLPLLLAIQPADERQAEALRRLRAWDAVMDRDRSEPLIYLAWYRELGRAIYADELGELFPEFWNLRPQFMERVLTVSPRWCNDVTTESVESCPDRIALALTRALDYLAARHGDDMDDWRWGAAHTAHSEHRPFSGQPVVGKIFDIDLPSSGDSFTVAAAHHRINREATPFRQHHGASLRAIYDLSDLDHSLFIQSTGQSGNPLSRFYRSFARTWRDGGYVPMTTDRSDIQAGAIGTLFLDPVR